MGRLRKKSCRWVYSDTCRDLLALHFPFPLMHIDTEHNFLEVIESGDPQAAELASG